MKVYTRVRIDINTGQILEEDSFQYYGPLALCLNGDDPDSDFDSSTGAGTGWGDVDPGIDNPENDPRGFQDVGGFDADSGRPFNAIAGSVLENTLARYMETDQGKGWMKEIFGEISEGGKVTSLRDLAKNMLGFGKGKVESGLAKMGLAIASGNPLGAAIGFIDTAIRAVKERSRTIDEAAGVLGISADSAGNLFDALAGDFENREEGRGGDIENPYVWNADGTNPGMNGGTGGSATGGGNGAGDGTLSPYQGPGSTSQDFYSAYHPGRSTPPQFSRDQQRNIIANAYRQNLGREAAPEELDHWERNINNGNITPDMAVQSISQSPEAGQFTGQSLPPQAGPGQILPGAGGAGGAPNNALSSAPISNLVSGAVGPQGGNASPGAFSRTDQPMFTREVGPGFQAGPGNALPAPSGNPYVENRITPGNQYGTVEDMFRANLPNLQNALRTGRSDFEEGYDRSVQSYEEAYSRAVAHMEQAWQRGETNVNKMLAETREILAPYGEAGEAALGRLDQAMAGDFSSFRESPDYKFRLEQGQKALVNQLSAQGETGASGGQMSGRFGKALTEYGQGLASTEYGNWFNRNMSLANQGLQARGIETNALTQAGGTLANLAGNVGQGQASAATVAGSGRAAAAQTTAAGKAGLVKDITDMTTRYGIAARSADVGNALKNEALGIDWAKLATGETEAGRQRDWETAMAERGYDISGNENQRNRQTNLWNQAIGVGGYVAGQAIANDWWPF